MARKAMVDIVMDEDEIFWAECWACPGGFESYSSDRDIVDEALKEHMEDVHGVTVDSFPYLLEDPR